MSPRDVWRGIIDDAADSYRGLKKNTEAALAQIGDEFFFAAPAAESNSIAVIVKHVGGNLRSRWTDVLTTDGEKPDRDRDSEFVVAPGESRAALMSIWEDGWAALEHALSAMRNAPPETVITIRDEPHSLAKAIFRNLAHTAYHTGQIIYLAKLGVPEGWKWITIAPGGSREFNERKRAEGGSR